MHAGRQPCPLICLVWLHSCYGDGVTRTWDRDLCPPDLRHLHLAVLRGMSVDPRPSPFEEPCMDPLHLHLGVGTQSCEGGGTAQGCRRHFPQLGHRREDRAHRPGSEPLPLMPVLPIIRRRTEITKRWLGSHISVEMCSVRPTRFCFKLVATKLTGTFLMTDCWY